MQTKQLTVKMNVAITSTTAAAICLPRSHHHCLRYFRFSSWKSKYRLMSMNSNSTAPSTTSSPTAATECQAVVKPTKQQQQWLILGLGNPGKTYQGTRHNVGFEMLDAIAQAYEISLSNVSFKALVGKGFIEDVPVMLAKPQTFMNSSGESAGAIVSYYKIPLSQVLVIFDDLDLPFAKLRLLPKGGHGGQNGMRSIIQHFKGSHDFARLRIGIGRPPGKMDPVKYVMRPFNKREREELDYTFERGTEAVRILLKEGFNKAATYVNSAKSAELN